MRREQDADVGALFVEKSSAVFAMSMARELHTLVLVGVLLFSVLCAAEYLFPRFGLVSKSICLWPSCPVALCIPRANLTYQERLDQKVLILVNIYILQEQNLSL